MIKDFLTYFPLWMPVKSRQRVLTDTRGSYWAGRLIQLMLSSPQGDYPGIVDSGDCVKLRRSNREYLMYAFAKDNPEAFVESEEDWQLAMANRLMEALKKSLYNENARNTSWKDMLGLELELTHMHKPSARLRFHWCEIQGSIDTVKLWTFLDSRQHSLESLYIKRWADKRYGFATKKTCPIPHSVDALDAMDPFSLGIPLEIPMRQIMGRWNILCARDMSGSTIHARAYTDSEAMGGLLIRNAMHLKQPFILADMPGTVQADLLDKLVVETMNQVSSLKEPYQWTWPTFHLPATVRAELLKLTEEIPCGTTSETAREDS